MIKKFTTAKTRGISQVPVTACAGVCPVCATYLEFMPGLNWLPVHAPPGGLPGICSASHVSVYRARRLLREGRKVSKP
jgi:hypothetical protein